jgi:hypothetical protein
MVCLENDDASIRVMSCREGGATSSEERLFSAETMNKKMINKMMAKTLPPRSCFR